jgi:hypothetical protein
MDSLTTVSRSIGGPTSAGLNRERSRNERSRLSQKVPCVHWRASHTLANRSIHIRLKLPRLPTGIGDEGQHGARGDPADGNATYATSSPEPEGRRQSSVVAKRRAPVVRPSRFVLPCIISASSSTRVAPPVTLGSARLRGHIRRPGQQVQFITNASRQLFVNFSTRCLRSGRLR